MGIEWEFIDPIQFGGITEMSEVVKSELVRRGKRTTPDEYTPLSDFPRVRHEIEKPFK